MGEKRKTGLVIYNIIRYGDTQPTGEHNLLAREGPINTVTYLAFNLLLLYREVWPEESAFGGFHIEPEQELTLLRDIFKARLGQSAGKWKLQLGGRELLFKTLCFPGTDRSSSLLAELK